MINPEKDVILAALKLARAMRRCAPPPAEHPFPPAVGRLLACVSANPHVSSRDLCEFLDLRPSSLSEMLARAENEGWIIRTTDEEDRRIQRVDLSEKGSALIREMEDARSRDLALKSACFTEEEKAQFCALSNKLSEHLESLAAGLPRRFPRGPHSPGPFGRPSRPGFPDSPETPDAAEAPEPPEPSDIPEASGPQEDAPGKFRLPPNPRIRC